MATPRLARLRFVCLLVLFTAALDAATILNENFDGVFNPSTNGWVRVNNSTGPGTTGWFQGNPGVFAAQSGQPSSYIAANYQNAAFGGDISDWLITPVVNLENGETLSFFTRTESGGPPDRLEVRLSLNGSSANAGSTTTSVGDFTTVLLTLNGTLSSGGYPVNWTPYTLSVQGLSSAAQGRFGFRYTVTNTAVNGDYIGIDSVIISSAVPVFVPEPDTFASAGLVNILCIGFALWDRLPFRKRRTTK
ncbi:MAG: hypothetical protein QOJ99_491 [Bryobacterales bacterium]|jgi:hypothetical protein|nr:hypothetical protein [Bryobacterales bacterium]